MNKIEKWASETERMHACVCVCACVCSCMCGHSDVCVCVCDKEVECGEHNKTKTAILNRSSI